ncbi:porphobilinogen synthase [bacterium]|nr:porphobilinogen synthase [bacterium]
MKFPLYRARRLRKNETLRSMVRENHLSLNDLIYPLFLIEGNNIKNPVKAMPGVFQYSLDRVGEEIKEIQSLGIPAVILFGIPQKKDSRGSEAYNPQGIIQKGIQAIKEVHPHLFVITDVCLCEYTDHGHCGVVDKGEIQNDPTLELLSQQAVTHVEAGADMVAPSDMMDGRVSAIRQALDGNNYSHIPIMSYAAKYASAFYGPFREAASSAPQFGDRRSHQMDPSNKREALKEVILDVEENADVVMVKPALPYLDIIHLVRENVHLPVAAYCVSGEYSMIKAAAEKGWVDYEKVMMETLVSIKRAGADLILNYMAKDAAKILNGVKIP